MTSLSVSVARSTLVTLLCLATACGPPRVGSEPPAHSDPIANVPAAGLYERGVARARSGDLGRAEQYLAAALSKGFSPSVALPVLLRVCVAANRYRHALAYARPFLHSGSVDWPLRYLVSSIYLALGQYQEAREELARVLEAAPDEPGPHFLFAELLKDEEPAKAREHYVRYLDLDGTGRHAGAARDAIGAIEAGAGARVWRRVMPNEEIAEEIEPSVVDDAAVGTGSETEVAPTDDVRSEGIEEDSP